MITVEIGEGRRQVQENGVASFDGDDSDPDGNGRQDCDRKSSCKHKNTQS